MDWQTELFGVAVLAIIFLSLICIAETWSRLGNPTPEASRKFVHFSGGFACLLFPAFVTSPLVVFFIAVAMCGMFLLGKRLRFLKSLHNINRETHGTAYYPLAIFLVFWLSGDQTWLFVCSVLVLATADSAAALVGMRYGSLRYTVEDESKSLEGSLAFFLIAFLAVYLPIWLLTQLPPGIAVLSALLVAFLVTGLEAVSLHGADNLFIPLGVCMILKKITTKPLAEVIYQNLSLLAFCLIVALTICRYPALNVGGSILFILFAFAAWSLGSESWALPVLLSFATYIISWGILFSLKDYSRVVRVKLVARAVLIPFLVLLAANLLSAYQIFFGPFLAAVATALVVSLWAHIIEKREEEYRSSLLALFVSLLACTVVAVPCWLLQTKVALSALFCQFLVVAAISVANHLIRLKYSPLDSDLNSPHHWDHLSFILTLVSVCSIGAAQILGAGYWNPADILGVRLVPLFPY